MQIFISSHFHIIQQTSSWLLVLWFQMFYMVTWDAFAKLVQHSISVAYMGRVLKTTLSFLLAEIIWPKECNIAAAFRK